LEDVAAAVPIDSHSEEPEIDPDIIPNPSGIRSQEAIYQYLAGLRANQ
jgi:hypothetical protein